MAPRERAYFSISEREPVCIVPENTIHLPEMGDDTSTFCVGLGEGLGLEIGFNALRYASMDSSEGLK